jgi:hypothetical protein
MTPNPILEELHKTREKLLESAGGTLAGLVAELQEEERKSGRVVLDPKELRRRREAAKNGAFARSASATSATPS